MPYGHTRTLDLPFQDAVTRVKDAFGAQGFGTLTEIDVRATLKERLGHDTEPYLILGACNPQLAHQALQIEPELARRVPDDDRSADRGRRNASFATTVRAGNCGWSTGR